MRVTALSPRDSDRPAADDPLTERLAFVLYGSLGCLKPASLVTNTGVKFELQFSVKIDSQSILSAFTHWVLPRGIVETGLSGLHKLYATKFLFFCHLLLGKSGITHFFTMLCYTLQHKARYSILYSARYDPSSKKS